MAVLSFFARETYSFVDTGKRPGDDGLREVANYVRSLARPNGSL